MKAKPQSQITRFSVFEAFSFLLDDGTGRSGKPTHDEAPASPDEETAEGERL